MIQLHTYVEARLGRWQLWYRWGKNPGPSPVESWYGPIVLNPNVQQSGRHDSACPVDVSEAEETQRCVMALGVECPELKDTVFEAYLRGGTVEQKIATLGLKSRQSYYDRLDRAYVKLLGHFNDAASGIALPVISAACAPVPIATKRARPRPKVRLRIAFEQL